MSSTTSPPATSAAISTASISPPPASPTSPATTSTSSASSKIAETTKPTAGAIAGGVVGGVVFLVCVALALLLFLRARKRRRTAPSSEFMNSLKPGATPVLRLDSGAEYAPAASEKGGFTHYPQPVPLPFMQDSYYTSPAMQDMKFPDSMMPSDTTSARPSIDIPLRPQRLSAQHANDSFVGPVQLLSSSVGSRRELWGSDAEMYAREPSPALRSRGPDLAPTKAQQSPSYEPLLQNSYPVLWQLALPTESDTKSINTPAPTHVRRTSSLQPLRREPDPEGT
ncbi:hypothetical protein HYDPIDRAFT_116942 [Hydnomerulius pinastri MD-312]|uniref:Uncharacterized protein n=1 Tax=Hydnomerulius pinastri MD-312 TaxID=994086 RepID=A0A0C9W3B9_9AGAM|nr:hypothetical protein HYDPIDRAFT_116942 [Hydnomerulius pinastri MD-312]